MSNGVFGRSNEQDRRRGDRHDVEEPVETRVHAARGAGRSSRPGRRRSRRRRALVGVGQEVAAPCGGSPRRGRRPGANTWREVVVGRLAARLRPAVTEPSGRRRPGRRTRRRARARPPITTTKARIATAARRWVSRFAAAGCHASVGRPAVRQQVLERGRRAGRTRRRPRPRARPAEAWTAATPPVTLSASGIGERSGAPASGSAGRTGTSVATGGSTRPRSPRTRSSRRCRCRRPREAVVEVLHRRLRVERDHRVLELVGRRAGHDVRRDEDERVADRDLAAPDVGLEVARRQAALAVRVRQRRQPGLADQVGLGRADRRDVQLVAADDRDADPDRAVLAVAVQAEPVALVVQPLVRGRDRLLDADPDPGRLVVVVLAPDRLGGELRRLLGRWPTRPSRSRSGRGCPWSGRSRRSSARRSRRCRASRRTRSGSAITPSFICRRTAKQVSRGGGSPGTMGGADRRAGSRYDRDARPENGWQVRAEYTRRRPRAAGRGTRRLARRRPRRATAANAASSSATRSRSSWATIGASASTTIAKPSSDRRGRRRRRPARARRRAARTSPSPATGAARPRARGRGRRRQEVADPDHRPAPARSRPRSPGSPRRRPIEPGARRRPGDLPGRRRGDQRRIEVVERRRRDERLGQLRRSAGRGGRAAPDRAPRTRRRGGGAAAGRPGRSGGRARRA